MIEDFSTNIVANNLNITGCPIFLEHPVHSSQISENDARTVVANGIRKFSNYLISFISGNLICAYARRHTHKNKDYLHSTNNLTSAPYDSIFVLQHPQLF